MKQIKKCVFCGSNAGNAEHVFPDWLSKEFGQRDSLVVMQQDGGVSRKWPSKIFQHKVKSVCQACNNGWMSDIEGGVKDYLGGMALGSKLPQWLDEDMQRKLALWAQKTFLVIQSMYPGEKRNATPRMFMELYERKDVLLLSATFVGFNQSHAEQDGRAVGTLTSQISSVKCSQADADYFKDQIAIGRRLIVAGMQLGTVNFFDVAGDMENTTIEFEVKNGMLTLQLIAP